MISLSMIVASVPYIILLYYIFSASTDDVKRYLDDYISKSRHIIDDDQELCLLCIQCLEVKTINIYIILFISMIYYFRMPFINNTVVLPFKKGFHMLSSYYMKELKLLEYILTPQRILILHI